MSIADKLLYLNETKRQLREAINAAFGAGLTEVDPFRSYLDPMWEHYILGTLFGSGEQGAWYDPSDLSTLFQDAAGTIPVTEDGDPVGLILDKSGNGNHASQAASSARPTYNTNGISHWLYFDGVDDGLATASVDMTSKSKISVHVGIQKIGISRGIMVEQGTSSAFQGWILNTPDSGNTLYSFVTYGIPAGNLSVAGTNNPAHNSPVITGYAELGVLGTVLRVGGEVVSAAAGPAAATTFQNTPIRIGRRGSTNLFHGNLYGMVIRSALPEDPENIPLESYLAAKSGVSLP